MQKSAGRERTAALCKQLEWQLSVHFRKYLMYKSGAHPPSHLREGETLCFGILSIRAGCVEADPDPLDLSKSVNPVTQQLGATPFAYPTSRL